MNFSFLLDDYYNFTFQPFDFFNSIFTLHVNRLTFEMKAMMDANYT